MSGGEARAAVARYHALSKHHFDRYAPGPGQMDWATQPGPFRSYEGAPRLELPLAADDLATPWAEVRRGALPEAAPLALRSVATLLELSLGLSAWKSFGGASWALRCNPSSGNLHPTEGYVVCPDLPGLPAGVHHYLSRDHVLERRAALGEGAAFPPGGLLLGLASIHWRESWKYGARAFRYCQHDCGHAIAAASYAAAALGWQARLLPGWGDAEVAALLGLGQAGAEEEVPDCLLWVGPQAQAPRPDELPPPAAWQGTPNRLSPAQRDWPQIAQVHEATAYPGGEADSPRRAAELPPLPPGPAEPAAARLFRQRRSAVDFDGTTGIGAETFFAMLDAVLPRPGVPPWNAWPWPPRIHLALFVHRVRGLAPGLYLLARDAGAVPALRAAMRPEWQWEHAGPPHLPLYRLIAHDLRDAARAVSCHQDIAADSCCALGMLAEFDAALDLGPWWYRRLFWESGLVGQALYLEAEAAGVRGTGIGCFFDDEMHRLLGLSGEAWQSLYHFTVGGPVEDSRLTTLPPYAHLKR